MAKHSKTCLAACAVTALAGAPALASDTLVRLDKSVVQIAPDVQVLGAADQDAVLRFHLALRPRETAELEARLARRQQTSAQEMRSRFLPAEADYQTVLAWARSAGLTVERTSPTRLMVEVSGSVRTVSAALSVRLAHVRSQGVDYLSAVSAPAVPEALAHVLVGINGLQPYQHYHTFHIRAPRASGQSGYTPFALREAYQATKLTQTGAGTTTAIIIDTFPNTSDLNTYWQDTGTAQSLSNITFITASIGTPPPPSGEESIDTELASALAPNSKVRVYATVSLQNANVDNGYEAVVLDAIDGVKIDQVSISLGECEAGVSQTQAVTDLYYHEILASLGATVLVATGDSGSHECGTSNGNIPAFDSTSPYVVGVGGTTLKLSTKGKATETAWSGSGGGLSVLFVKPAFQSSLNLSARGVPDVAAVGDPNTGVAIVLNGNIVVYGGTSVATPIWAGLMALVNEARLSAGKTTLGLLDPLLYPSLGTANFRDIKTGNNGGYAAKAGYDLVTGIGTPLMDKLLPTLLSK